MPADRNYKLDHAKLLFIFCVVLGHIAAVFEKDSTPLHCARVYVYLFHVPGFVFVSGLFAKSSVKNNRWDRAVSFILLFLFMTIVKCAFALIRKASPRLDLLDVTDTRWYALGMFFWYAASILLKRANPRWVMLGAVLLSMAAGYFPDRYANTFALLRAVNFFPFFYAGLLTDPKRLTDLLGKKQIRIASAAIVLAAAALVSLKIKGLSAWLHLFRALCAYREIDTVLPVWSGAFWRLGAFLVSAVMGLAWISVMPGKQIPIISDFGARTLPVYAFHGPVYQTILYLLPVLDEGIRKSPFILGLLFSVFILVICSLPVFDRSVRKFMSLAIKKEENT